MNGLHLGGLLPMAVSRIGYFLPKSRRGGTPRANPFKTAHHCGLSHRYQTTRQSRLRVRETEQTFFSSAN